MKANNKCFVCGEKLPEMTFDQAMEISSKVEEMKKEIGVGRAAHEFFIEICDECCRITPVQPGGRRPESCGATVRAYKPRNLWQVELHEVHGGEEKTVTKMRFKSRGEADLFVASSKQACRDAFGPEMTFTTLDLA